MSKLILRCFLSPGDIVMLTAAVRDLHRNHPDKFTTDVRTACPALWENNPHVTPIDDDDPDARIIECHYPLVHRSNQRPYHFIHGYMQFLSEELKIDVTPTAFHGDIHLSPEERAAPPRAVGDANGSEADQSLPMWIVAAGGKYDYTIKWWNWRRYQKVIDHFKGRIRFVQVGESGHYHPPLRNVTDLRGKTSLRDLVRLMHHADGLLCGVTLHMHLAAAVPARPKQTSRPAVVVAGGREAPHWEAYPTHQFLHTVGMLDCCATGGCWKARTLPLGDKDEKDQPNQLCVDVIKGLPRCMHMITPDQVVSTIEMILQGRRESKTAGNRDHPGDRGTHANHSPEPKLIRQSDGAVSRSLGKQEESAFRGNNLPAVR